MGLISALATRMRRATPSRVSSSSIPAALATEILLAYGSVRFGSKVGQLAGNHFLTIVEGAEHLPELGRLTLWQGAQTIEFAPV